MKAPAQERLAALHAELKAELWKYETTLCELTARVTFSQAVEDELVSASRGKEFVIRNDHAWWTLRDTHDMLVINLASYVRGLSDEGGLFRQIRGKWMPVLKSKPQLDGVAPWLEKVIKATSREIVEQRFPNVSKRDEIRVEHLDAAVKAVEEQLESLLQDRDRNRAHRYQHQSVGDARPLGTHDLRVAAELLQELLKDVRYLAEASSFEYPDNIFHSPADGIAEELVDQVLLGTRTQRDLLEGRMLHGELSLGYSWQRRDRVYEVLHRRHDSLAEPSAECFNSDEAIIGDDQ